MKQPDKLYGGVTEEKWKERLYRAWRWSKTPTEEVWNLFEPLLRENERLRKELEWFSKPRSNEEMLEHDLPAFKKAVEDYWNKDSENCTYPDCCETKITFEKEILGREITCKNIDCAFGNPPKTSES